MEIKDKYLLATKRNKINIIEYWMIVRTRRLWFMIITLDKNRKFYKNILNTLYGRSDLNEIWRDVLECKGNTSLPKKL